MAMVNTVAISCVLNIYYFNNDCDSNDNKNIIQKAKHKIAL